MSLSSGGLTIVGEGGEIENAFSSPDSTPARGPRIPKRLYLPIPGTGFNTLSHKISELDWVVVSDKMEVKFKSSVLDPGSPDTQRCFAEVRIPWVWHERRGEDSSFEEHATASTSLSGGTGPRMSSEMSVESMEDVAHEFVSERPTTLHLHAGGWFPGTYNAGRHVSLLYMDVKGDVAPYKAQLERCMEQIRERKVSYKLRFAKVTDSLIQLHTDWKYRTAVFSVEVDCEFDREVLQELKGTLYRVVAARQTLGAGVPLELRVPNSHVTFW
jgi:hypothetical protein